MAMTVDQKRKQLQARAGADDVDIAHLTRVVELPEMCQNPAEVKRIIVYALTLQ